MFDLSQIGRWVVMAGLALAAIGGLIWLAGRVGLPLGRLPGDIRIQRDGFSCFIPLASSILISILLTVVLNVIVRLINR
jgi:Protein of unknown function (DUF2905)